MSTVELTAESRQKLGRQVKSLRREGLVPANIVSRGKDSRAIQVNYLALEKTLHQVGYTQPVKLAVGDDTVTVLVTDISLTPARNTLEHVTFQEVKKGEMITADVPLRLVGDAPATQQGLLILQLADTVEVEAGALSIPEHFDIDISSLEEDGDTVKVSQITVPEGVEIKTDPDMGVVKAEEPRAPEPEPEADEEIEGEEGSEEGEEGDSETDDKNDAGSGDKQESRE